jgi:hypothetical protein
MGSAKETVISFVLHTPKDIVWRGDRKREFSPIIQREVHIEIVILWIAPSQIR